MASRVAQYKGFILSASARAMVQGFSNQVCLTRHNGPDTKEMILTPSLPNLPYADEGEALESALNYGRAAIDGLIAGIDVASLY